MIKSMTGFGQAEVKSSQGCIRVEIKSTNHKFFEFSCRLPGYLAELEEPIRKKVALEVRRGKVSLFILAPDPAAFTSRLILNEPLAREVFHKIRRVKKVLALEGKVSDDAVLQEVLRTPDVLIRDNGTGRRNGYSRNLFLAVQRALGRLAKSKALEGRALEADFRHRIAEIKRSLVAIQKRVPASARQFRKDLKAKMKDFIKDGKLDGERLTLEVALYVKNSDISEELTRLKSHVSTLQKTLKESGELGRKIDFIAQEMYREANTIGAKSSDVGISGAVIAVKSAIEKIREQAQNAE